MRVGIMTGGGDCPGLNAVIRAVVDVGIERHGFEIFGIEDSFAGLIDLAYRSPDGNRWLTARDVRGVLPRGGTLLGTSNHADPFRFVVVNERGERVETDVSEQVIRNFEKVGLDALVSIGGDGSARIAKKFSDRGIPLVVVPKTIDNDLDMTDQTFGFDTAVGIATEALDRVRDTAASHDRLMIVEVMGRDAGWIALHAGIASAADAILIPEIPYRIEPLIEMIESRKRRGMVHSVVVISEGAKPAGGASSFHRGQARRDPAPRRAPPSARARAGGANEHRDPRHGPRAHPAWRQPDQLRSHLGDALRAPRRRSRGGAPVRQDGRPPMWTGRGHPARRGRGEPEARPPG